MKLQKVIKRARSFAELTNEGGRRGSVNARKGEEVEVPQRPFLTRLIPAFGWLRSYDGKWLRGDLIAGLTLAAYLLPAGNFDAAPLHPSWETTCVQMRGGKTTLKNGPFVETREQLSGYFLIDVRDLNEAIEIATRIPGTQFGTVEVRQVMEVDGLPGR